MHKVSLKNFFFLVHGRNYQSFYLGKGKSIAKKGGLHKNNYADEIILHILDRGNVVLERP